MQFTLIDLQSLLENFGLHAEHDGYWAELEALDFRKEADARYAVRTWIIPALDDSWHKTVEGRLRFKNAFRVAMSRWGFVPQGPVLPGLEGELIAVKQLYSSQRRFYLWMWDEIYSEPLDWVTETASLCERIDADFVNFRTDPTKWGSPQYRAIDYWDATLDVAAWRVGWPPLSAIGDA